MRSPGVSPAAPVPKGKSPSAASPLLSSPGLHVPGIPKEKKNNPVGAVAANSNALPFPVRHGPGASQSRLQVGIHHGLSVWRLDVVGCFLELQQHGHLCRGEGTDW